jgi:hypothetical protein
MNVLDLDVYVDVYLDVYGMYVWMNIWMCADFVIPVVLVILFFTFF